MRHFRAGADTFAGLGRGEAIIYGTLGGQPRRTSPLILRVIEHALSTRAEQAAWIEYTAWGIKSTTT